MLDKVIFPVAGWGTRFLPATKALPKEMLPVGTKPLIQYAVEEAVAAGFSQMIFVTQKGKSAIANHFDTHHLLESFLKNQGKAEALKAVQDCILPNAYYVRQPYPWGLGHAILCAEPMIKDEAFGVILPDDLIIGAGIKDLVTQYDRKPGYYASVMRVCEQETHLYGMAKMLNDHSPYVIDDIVEKPQHTDRRMAIVGRYILQSDIFQALKSGLPVAKGDELNLTNALCTKCDRLFGIELTGKRFDCGKPQGWLQANQLLLGN